METINVALGERSYDILIERGLLDRAAEYLAPLARDGRLLVVSDETVWSAVSGRLRGSLSAIEAIPVLVPAGEGSKSWAGLQAVVDALLAQGVERSDNVVAFGGGVVGDLAGFAAAIVNRGCGFVQVPTSLLAQVDSSVGGKTAINVVAGKNLVGAFHQPSLVLIDPSLLDTLDPREVRAGYAEIVKYALIEDADLFAWLEDNGAKVLAGDPGARTHAIAAAVGGKARIVEEDERETSGRRALLNLGHTFGHALEAETGYSDRLLHGEAVALGCVLAFDYSAELGLCRRADSERVRRHFFNIGLPTTLAEIGLGIGEDRGERLVNHMRHDKKRERGRTAFILVRGIGEAFVDNEVELADVGAFLDWAM
jgi:3-dehydroquinate synthase